jgi:OOP family OmpA-OmpF porin
MFLFLCFQYSISQNLIPDSSFEFNKSMPLNFSQINCSNSWGLPSIGTSDLFCKCSKKQSKASLVNVPANLMGNQYARSGSCYGGFFAFSHGHYREYIQTTLQAPLQKDKFYQFKMYVSLSDYSRAAVDQLGVCFIKSELHIKTSDVLEMLNPYYMNIEKEVMADTTDWHCLNVLYKATGGESYIIIGSFALNNIYKTKVKAPKEVKSRINQFSDRDAYYYVDDVSLIETTDTIINNQQHITPAVAITDSVAHLSVNTSFVLENVLFNTNEAIVQAVSFTELDKLAAYLKANAQIDVNISGHTDNKGNELLNQKLSLNRAKAVCDYLITKHIDKQRMTYDGYGSEKPIDTNETEAGRQKNRRVESLITYKSNDISPLKKK